MRQPSASEPKAESIMKRLLGKFADRRSIFLIPIIIVLVALAIRLHIIFLGDRRNFDVIGAAYLLEAMIIAGAILIEASCFLFSRKGNRRDIRFNRVWRCCFYIILIWSVKIAALALGLYRGDATTLLGGLYLVLECSFGEILFSFLGIASVPKEYQRRKSATLAFCCSIAVSAILIEIALQGPPDLIGRLLSFW